MGLEIVSLDPMNVMIEWPYEALFQDEQEQTNAN